MMLFIPASPTLKEVLQQIQPDSWCEFKYRGQRGTTFQPDSHFCAGPQTHTDVTSVVR